MSRYVSATHRNLHAFTSNLQRRMTETTSRRHHKTSKRQYINEDAPPEAKLGTFSGSFVPTTLNVLSILLFLRFGFIIGQTGIIGSLGMLIISYFITFLTILSVSAISTNGTVRGGGAYYMISRSLGPEFGGSIGIVFYIGQVLNSGMNVVGFIEPLLYNFGVRDSGGVLPDSRGYEILYSTIMLLTCTIVCLIGSKLFTRAGNLLFAAQIIALASVPVTALVQAPFTKQSLHLVYTGISIKTLKGNLWPHFTKGAAGSAIKGHESMRSVFGVFFPATAGIFAGASMSGDLKYPSKAIPRGTMYGWVLTFCIYIVIILSLTFTVERESFYKDVNVMQHINISKYFILVGALSSSFFSALLGIIGCAKLLQAIALDNLLPALSVFGASNKRDDPVYAIILTYALTQLTVFMNLNQIASYVTMTCLLTFLVINLACLLLSLTSAPNWRPSFHLFSWQTALGGLALSLIAMFYTDVVAASLSVLFAVILFIIIHFVHPPKAWGDVTQGLIYHQVRKFLLRLDMRKDHVKFWRPQILVLVHDPHRSWRMIQFGNSLKKTGLYILGHVIVVPEFSFDGCLVELKKQRAAWLKFIDLSKIKAFIQITAAPDEAWGVRNLVLTSGLGGMRPNIVMMGLFNLEEYNKRRPKSGILEPPQTPHNTLSRMHSRNSINISRTVENSILPTDILRSEPDVKPTVWMTALEDILFSLDINIAIAKGFENMELPEEVQSEKYAKRYIDLWPIQMSAQIGKAPSGKDSENLVTTNFDTYTMILQMGCILHKSKAWRTKYKLRVIVFVEHQKDVEEERSRVQALLDSLRIDAKLIILWLACGKFSTYETIINGAPDHDEFVNSILGHEDWYKTLKKHHSKDDLQSASPSGMMKSDLFHDTNLAFLDDEGPSSLPKKIFNKHHLNLGSRHSITTFGVPLSFSMRINVPHATQYESSSDEELDFSTSGELDSSDEDSILTATPYRDEEESVGSPTKGTMSGSGFLPPKSPANKNLRFAEQSYISSDNSRASSPRRPSQRKRSRKFSQKKQIDFNSLPTSGQHLILNELIQFQSTDTSVVFTTLPTPHMNTCRSERQSIQYLNTLKILLNDLPPTILIHSKSLTVTTAL